MKVELTEEELFNYLTWKKEKEERKAVPEIISAPNQFIVDREPTVEELIERLKAKATRVQAINRSNMYVYECKGFRATLTVREEFPK